MGFDFTGLGSAFDFAGGLLDRFFPKQMTESDRAEMQAQLSQAIDERDTKRDEFKRDVLVAELGQDDKFTKRARPSIIYAGLVFIFLVHVLFPLLFILIVSFSTSDKPMPALPALALPEQFWWAWTGICSVWVMGRSAEKGGMAGKVVTMITGNKKTWSK